MKLHEIASLQPSDESKLQVLKTLIQHGQQPKIVNATYSSGHFAWGDLEKLGFAERGERRTRRGIGDEWWTYTGPGSILLITQTSTIAGGKTSQGEERIVMNKGDTTDPVEVDYT